MRKIGALWPKLRLMWEGAGDEPRALRLERRFVLIRWLGIAFVAPGLLLAGLSSWQLLDAYGVLAFAALYNLVIHLLLLRRPALLAGGLTSTVGDAILNIVMVTAAGGFGSPIYYILYTVTISAAMRYGYSISVLMALLFVSADLVEGMGRSLVLTLPFVVRSGFLVITALLAGYLHEEAVRAEAALNERLSRANELTAATAKIGASLDLDTVLQATVRGAAELFGTDYVLLQPTSLLEGVGATAPVASGPPEAPPGWWDELAAACSLVAEHGTLASDAESPISQEVLRTGQTVTFLAVGRLTRQEPLAILAVVTSASKRRTPIAADIVKSFREHATLAIENASLYRSLASRSRDLQDAYSDLAVAHQELLRVAEMKTNFLANVSHEFRTPLSSIRSFSELLLSYDDPTVQRDFLEIINKESERLTRMVNDVLDITRIESGHMPWDMTDIDVAYLARESARPYLSLMDRNNLTFSEEVAPNLPRIYGDRDRLSQVIGNLLDNAVKFTRRGTVRLRAYPDGDGVRIEVSDTGVGVAPKDQVNIFEKFQQVGEVLTDKPRGAGLGLSICREITEHHGGRIWVESELGVGSTFIVRLPAINKAPHKNGQAKPGLLLVAAR
jgi:signal transduction histidine kinase